MYALFILKEPFKIIYCDEKSCTVEMKVNRVEVSQVQNGYRPIPKSNVSETLALERVEDLFLKIM